VLARKKVEHCTGPSIVLETRIVLERARRAVIDIGQHTPLIETRRQWSRVVSL
jgi:hypothetical protein